MAAMLYEDFQFVSAFAVLQQYSCIDEVHTWIAKRRFASIKTAPMQLWWTSELIRYVSDGLRQYGTTAFSYSNIGIWSKNVLVKFTSAFKLLSYRTSKNYENGRVLLHVLRPKKNIDFRFRNHWCDGSHWRAKWIMVYHDTQLAWGACARGRGNGRVSASLEGPWQHRGRWRGWKTEIVDEEPGLKHERAQETECSTHKLVTRLELQTMIAAGVKKKTGDTSASVLSDSMGDTKLATRQIQNGQRGKEEYIVPLGGRTHYRHHSTRKDGFSAAK